MSENNQDKKNEFYLDLLNNLNKNQLYLPEISAHRHLSRPLKRIGTVNKSTKFDKSLSWFCVYEK